MREFLPHSTIYDFYKLSLFLFMYPTSSVSCFLPGHSFLGGNLPVLTSSPSPSFPSISLLFWPLMSLSYIMYFYHSHHNPPKYNTCSFSFSSAVCLLSLAQASLLCASPKKSGYVIPSSLSPLLLLPTPLTLFSSPPHLSLPPHSLLPHPLHTHP